MTREEVAERLACVAWGRGVMTWSPALLRIADEVMRQMRWSRHEYRWASPETMEWDNGMDPTEDPTLAPPGWDPAKQDIVGEEWRK